MPQSDKDLMAIITRYNQPLTRLASMQLHNKSLAADIVKFVLEELYDQQLFYEGPQLRPLLIQRLHSACNIANRLQQVNAYKWSTQHSHSTTAN
ncbi:MAG: hypothetical protein EOO03_08695 [Chitinophagaceae bacterium]|nr:MAG: hypothetical protein EOO03_08695 [Chitinophagaceae bacterium]